ncbi:MAG TPA: hypothetical protein DCZ03_08700 [Gammaproteobacteria bacterium]|nr:hypothetical protein [Gammaproteobacteria bacterium]
MKNKKIFYGWKLLAALCVIYFLSIGTAFSGFAVLLPPILAEFNWSRTQAGGAFALATIALGVMGPLVALLMRQIGIRWTMALGGVVTSAASVVAYNMEQLWQLYLGVGFLLGTGMAMQTILPCSQVVTNWFYHRRSLAMGIFLASGGLGGFVWAPLFAALTEATGEWRYAASLIGVAAMVSSLMAMWIVRDRPEQVGEVVDGQEFNQSQTLSSEASKPKRVFRTEKDWETSLALKSWGFWIVVFTGATATLGVTIVNSQSMLHLQDLGIDAVTASQALGITGLVSTVGRLMSGFYGDRLEPKYLLSLGLLLVTIGMLLLGYATTTLFVFLYAVIFGLGYGMSLVASMALLANYFGSTHYGALFSVRGIVVTALGAIGPIAAGLSADNFDSYLPIFYLFSVMGVSAALIQFLTPAPIHPELKSKQKTVIEVEPCRASN